MVSPPSLSRYGRAYIGTVIVLGLWVVAASARELYVNPISYQWLLLAGLTLISGSATVKLPSVAASISISEAFVFTAILLYGPAAGTLTVALDGLAISYWIAKRRPEPARALFNMAAPALSAWCAGEMFFRASHIPPIAEARASLDAILPYLFLSATTYFGVNSSLIAFAIWAETHSNPLTVWRKNFIWLSLNYFCGASVAGLLVVYRPEVTLPYIGAALPILIVIYFTFKTTMGRVEDANRHVEKINALYLSTIETLAMAIDAKDQITHGHIRRVQKYAVGLAREVGVQEAPLLSAIEAAALLHDMGKLAIPEYILNKPGKLTDVEFEQMKGHATIGADILSSIDFPYPVVPIVRHHHENWDGTGYPAHLSGTEIPIGARILSVVDCFDALTSDRPYRVALSPQEAMQILLERRGTMYDPLVVDTFIRVHERLGVDEPATSLKTNVLKELSASHAPPTKLDDVPTHDNATLWLTASELAKVEFASDVSDIGDVAERALARLVAFEAFALFLRDAEAGELVPHFVAGRGTEPLNALRIPLGKGVSGWVAAHERTLCNLNAHLDLGLYTQQLVPTPVAVLSTPLVANGQAVGALTIYSANPKGFDAGDVAAVEALAAAISRPMAVARARCLAPDEKQWLALPDARKFGLALTTSAQRTDQACSVLLVESRCDVHTAESFERQPLAYALGRALLCKRPSDTLLRLGTDGFVVVVEAGPDEARPFAEKLTPRASTAANHGKPPLIVRMLSTPKDGDSLADLLLRAHAIPGEILFGVANQTQPS